MESDVKLNNGTVEITADKAKVDVGFGGGSIELNGSNLKTSVTDIEMYYYGGCLRAKAGNMEFGSRDNGTFKGYSQAKGGPISITGDKLVINCSQTELNGVMLIRNKGLEIVDPDLHISGEHVALSQGEGDTLLINGKSEYSNGVSIFGKVKVGADFTIEKLIKLPDPRDGIGKKYPPLIKLVEMNVFDQITALQKTIQELQTKINELESRLKP